MTIAAVEPMESLCRLWSSMLWSLHMSEANLAFPVGCPCVCIMMTLLPVKVLWFQVISRTQTFQRAQNSQVQRQFSSTFRQAQLQPSAVCKGSCHLSLPSHSIRVPRTACVTHPSCHFLQSVPCPHPAIALPSLSWAKAQHMVP